VAVVCNKIDLDRKISHNLCQKFTKENKTVLYECSAKSDINVTEPFSYIIKEVVKVKANTSGKQIGITINDTNSSSYLPCNC
jgi:translation elongation factor EF-4